MSETLTPEAIAYLTKHAEEAERDLSRLPESSQPLWFRLYKQGKLS